MPGRAVIVSLVALLGVVAARGAQQGFVSGKIVDVQQRSRERVQLYVVNTPIVREDPYVTMSVEVGGTRYDGEFLPSSGHELFPGRWKTDESVQLRIEKHFMYLKREDGSEGKFLIVHKSPLHSARESQ
jgi:hypothetical protein